MTDMPAGRRWVRRLVAIVAILVAAFLMWVIGGALFYDPRTPSFITAMKADLRYLVALQEDSLKASGKFVTHFDASVYSRNVRPGEIRLTSDGWSATVSHAILPHVCTIFVGSTPVAPATKPGEPVCTRP